MAMLSQTQLVSDLAAVFPEFSAYWESDRSDDDSPSITLHSVYLSFLPFLGGCSPTSLQWQQLANILSREVAAGGERENAVDTCMLEHLHQVKLNRVLRPLLSPAAKSLVRA